MAQSPTGSIPRTRAPATRRELERELDVVRSAVAMVATRGFPRVTVSGLRYGERLLPDAKVLARASGVVAQPLRAADGAGCGIAVERGPTGADGDPGRSEA